MAYFAEVIDGVVERVLSVPDEQEHRGQEFLSKDLNLGGIWIQTSFNKRIRNKYANPGDIYHSELDVFLEPKPYESWILNENTLEWASPVSHPSIANPDDTNIYEWNEDSISWEIVE